jgi:hypothetical protein
VFGGWQFSPELVVTVLILFLCFALMVAATPSNRLAFIQL